MTIVLERLASTSIAFLALCLATAALSSKAERPPTPEETESLFYRLTRPVPARLYLEAMEEVRQPSWSEEQMTQMLNQQERIMQKEDRRLSAAQKAKLRDARLQSIRAQHSGLRLVNYKLWRSGKLYRAEVQEVSSKNPLGYVYVNSHDRGFSTNFTGFVINKGIESASVYQNPSFRFKEAELWQAYTVEPDVAFLFLMSVVNTNSLRDGLTNSTTSSFAGYQLDSFRALELTRGANPDLAVSVEEEVLDGRQLLCFKCRAKKNSLFQRFWLDMTNSADLYKVQIDAASSSYISTRSSCDADGFPHEWSTLKISTNGIQKSTTVRFAVVDLKPDFNDAATFLPIFPTNYHVAAILQDGKGVPIQVPPRPVAKPRAQSSPWVKRTFQAALVLVTMIPLLVALKRRKS